MRNLTLIVFASAVVACGGGSANQTAVPAVAFSRAKTAFLQGKFKDALEDFRRAENLLPPSAPELAEVQFHIGESQFAVGDQLEAAQTFRRLADRFPRDNLAPLALLRAGDANAALWRRVELDPTYGTAAMAAYRELLGRYPNSEAATRGLGKAARLMNDFAHKRFRAGVFYMSRKAYDSAIIYFRDLIVEFPQATIVPDAYVRLTDAYDAIGYRAELEVTCDYLRQNYPQAAARAEHCTATD